LRGTAGPPARYGRDRNVAPTNGRPAGKGVPALQQTTTGGVPYGESTLDVYLNDVAYWRNVPERVWGYTIGGYQVMKKWLSYREEKLLGRSLTMDEAREVTNMARRIAVILLEPALDENYARVKAAAYSWPQAA